MRYITFAYLFLGTALCANVPVETVAPEFMYKGELIQPSCLDFTGEGSNKVVNLATDPCQKTDRHFDSKLMKKGYIGYASFYPDAPTSYFYYKYLGSLEIPTLGPKPYHIIFVEYSGGGTGQFTDLMAIEKDGDKLRYVKSLNGGDRCVGGLSDPSVIDGVLNYTQTVTPSQFYAEATGLENNPFSSCAICCLGKFTYQGTKVTGFTFDKDQYNYETSGSDPQSCFDKILMETFSGKKLTLTPTEIKALGEKVKSTCIQSSLESK